MGKILKYCTSCEEGFAEKFSFCPNCAKELSAMEMTPVSEDKASEASKPIEPPVEMTPEVNDEPIAEEEEEILTVVKDPSPVGEKVVERIEAQAEKDSEEETVFEPVAFEADEVSEADSEDIFSFDSTDNDVVTSDDAVEIEVEETEEENAFGVVAQIIAAEGFDETETVIDYDDAVAEDAEQTDYAYRFEDDQLDDEDYGVTVIGSEGSKLRSSLLIGASMLVLTVAISSLAYSLFNHPLFVAAIGGDELLLAVPDLAPLDIEEEPPPKADDDDSGGGGGGGKKRKAPASQGELPSQTREKIKPPTPMERMTNPTIAVINRTDGDIKRKTTDRTGLPNGLAGSISSGTGSGGGIGNGRGTGAGSGRGSGEGTGIGSGSGNGRGNGTGNGTGNGRRKPPPVKPKGPTVRIRILGKPRPGYTDQARQNNVQGVVLLRVTFLASGRIGRISAIKGLPHGLTAKAMAAARRINFKPKMVNGVPRSVTKRIQYNFTIY